VKLVKAFNLDIGMAFSVGIFINFSMGGTLTGFDSDLSVLRLILIELFGYVTVSIFVR